MIGFQVITYIFQQEGRPTGDAKSLLYVLLVVLATLPGFYLPFYNRQCYVILIGRCPAVL